MSLGVVGRESELAEVERFIDAADHGFAVLVLEGEAGIGKTTLWREVRRRAEERGYQVLWCRPAAAEAKFSFAGVADLLSAVDEEAFAALPEPQRAALEVALLRAAPPTRSPLSRAVSAAFLTLARGLAEKEQVLLAIDDWQWLDASSQRVIEFLTRRLESERVRLPCSIRAPVSAPPFDGTVAEGRGRGVVLGPLSLAALGRIVADRLGHSLPRPVLVRIVRVSAGNPFYALEVARLVIENGAERAPGSELPVPDDLRRVTAPRVRRLPEAAREAVLAAVLSRPDGETVDLRALEPAEDAGIVRGPARRGGRARRVARRDRRRRGADRARGRRDTAGAGGSPRTPTVGGGAFSLRRK